MVQGGLSLERPHITLAGRRSNGGSESQDSGGREDHDQPRQAAGARTTRSSPSSRATASGPISGRASVRVLDAAVAQAYGASARSRWVEVLRGGEGGVYGKDCPPNLAARRDPRRHPRVPGGHQGPAHHAGRRAAPLAERRLRQELDLYVCLRPVRWFKGVPSPVKDPEKIDMVIFRENTEDIYAGIEWMRARPRRKKVIEFLQKEMRRQEHPLPGSSPSASSRSRRKARSG